MQERLGLIRIILGNKNEQKWAHTLPDFKNYCKTAVDIM